MHRLVLLGVIAGCGAPEARPAQHVTLEEMAKEPEVDPIPESACEHRGPEFGPILLTAEIAAKRRGEGALRLAAAPSSEEKPIEVCGRWGENRWLHQVKCADGSFPEVPEHGVVIDTLGPCSTSVERFVVTCPDGSHEVYIDRSMCGPDESM